MSTHREGGPDQGEYSEGGGDQIRVSTHREGTSADQGEYSQRRRPVQIRVSTHGEGTRSG